MSEYKAVGDIGRYRDLNIEWVEAAAKNRKLDMNYCPTCHNADADCDCREETISTMDALYAKVNYLSEENAKLRKENEELWAKNDDLLNANEELNYQNNVLSGQLEEKTGFSDLEILAKLRKENSELSELTNDFRNSRNFFRDELKIQCGNNEGRNSAVNLFTIKCLEKMHSMLEGDLSHNKVGAVKSKIKDLLKKSFVRR